MTKSHVRDFEKHEFISSAELPNSWQLGKLKYALDRVMSGGTPDSSNAEYWTEKGLGIPWVNIGDMSKHEQVTKTQKEVTELGQSSKKLEVLKSGTIIYSIYATLGAVSELKIDAVINQALLGLYPKDDSEQKFMIYWLRFLRPHLRYFASSSTQFNLNAYKVSNFPYPILDGIEKQNISKFLDKEVSHINNLVQEKQNFINLLKEKRQALISHAVTKGLDPDVEMKDSGFDRFGEIPEQWGLVKLKNITTSGFKNGVFKKSEDFGFGTKLVNVSDIFTPDFYIVIPSLERVNVTDAEKLKYKVYNGDIFFVRSSLKLQGIGHACCYKGEDEDIVFECHIVKATPDPKKVDHDYLIHVLHSSQIRHHLVVESTTTTMTTIGQTGISKTVIPLPPLSEQKKIASSLLRQLDRIEKITAETYRSIGLLKEHKTALISAAVTGKIDLRDKEVA
jgi:restriction endonuclease S subunit